MTFNIKGFFYFMIQSEQKLFRSVLVQAILDGLNKFFDKRKSNIKHNQDALQWLKHKDFHYICDLADIQPDYILWVFTQLKNYNSNITYEQTKELLYETLTRQK
tara:strand:- start:552 stop:863 length:312 start_codon:yes stop_codon:yes gene_type:complete